MKGYLGGIFHAVLVTQVHLETSFEATRFRFTLSKGRMHSCGEPGIPRLLQTEGNISPENIQDEVSTFKCDVVVWDHQGFGNDYSSEIDVEMNKGLKVELSVAFMTIR